MSEPLTESRLRQIIREVLREELRAALSPSVLRAREIMDRWDGEGLPAEQFVDGSALTAHDLSKGYSLGTITFAPLAGGESQVLKGVMPSQPSPPQDRGEPDER